MFKVCIISCGMIANDAHIPAYRQFPEDYEIVGVCDINEKSAHDTALRHGIANWYTDAGQMLDELKPDVVSVCVPNCFHKEYTLTALNHGANVLCEKPLAFTKADAVEMFDCAKKNGKLLMACQSMRFTPDRLAAKKFVEDGGIGDVYYAGFSRIRRRGIPTWGAFHIKKMSRGGALVDIGVHMLDSLLWIIGNPKVRSVYGFTSQNHKYEMGSLVGSGALTGNVDNKRKFDPDEMDVEDFSNGVITFQNGMKVNFTVAWAANMPPLNEIRIAGKKAGLDLPNGKILFGEDGESDLKTEPLKYESSFAGHIYLADNIRKVLKGEEEPIVKPEETINVSEVLELFYESAETGTEAFAHEN